MYNYRKKNIIMIVMICMIMVMAVGYALLSTNLNIKGISDLTGSWDIKITNVTSSPTGRAYNITDPVYTNTTMKFNVGVKEPGDKVTFNVTVTNAGDIDAMLQSIDASASGSEVIIYSINGIQNEEVLKGGASKTFTITTEFDIDATSIPANPVKDLTVTLNYIQYDEQTLNPSDPIINEVDREATLVSQILANNDESRKDADPTIIAATTYTKYEQLLEISYHGVSFTSGTYYYFGTDYIFDESTGKFQLSGDITKSTWNSSLVGKYTCISSNRNWCDRIYKMTSYSVDTIGIADVYIGSQTSTTVTQPNGLFYTNVNTEDNKTTYYFRGDVTNNYVKFGTYVSEYSRYRAYYDGGSVSNYSMEFANSSECGSSYAGCEKYVYGTPGQDMYWRIVRINEDGSIRLIYAGTSVGATGEQMTIGDSHVYDATNATAIGYMYGSSSASTYLGAHTNTTNSVLKTMIDTWYQKGVINYSSYLADAGFCNDRSVAPSANLWYYNIFSSVNDTALGYGTNATYYGAYNRETNLKTPQFACPQTNDLFTTSTSDKGNKALNYPVGTITADEVMYAGYNSYLKSDKRYLTMSPLASSVNGDGGFYQFVGSGNVSNSTIWIGNFVRPVINLKANVEIVSGNGTSGNPYVIKTN